MHGTARRSLLVFWLLVVAVLAFPTTPLTLPPPPAYAANSLFSLGWSSTESQFPENVAVGDVNGDGKLDIVFGNSGGPSEVYLNDGQGRFTPTAAPIDPAGADMTNVALGDLNGDGTLDIVLGNAGKPSQVYLNDGQGGFTPTTAPLNPTGRPTWMVALGDLNGDGTLDILLNNGGVSQVYLNDGQGNFAPTAAPLNPTGNPTHSIALGDVNGDGTLDIVLGNYGEPSQVYLNDGQGRFTPIVAPLNPTGNQTESIALGDVNGDGTLDIVLGNYGEPSQVYLNDGHGRFTPTAAPLNPAGNAAQSVAWGDMDGDGDLDLAVGNSGQPNQVYRNDNGLLTASAVWSSPESDDTSSVAWGDMDGNGSLDLVVANKYLQPNRVYLNLAPVIQSTGERGIRDVTILENTSTIPFSFTLTDPDTPLDQLQVSATSSNPALINPGRIHLDGSGAERTITVIPDATDALSRTTAQGSALITLTVSDGQQTATKRFTVTVAPPPWLAMLYLAGDDLPGPASLSGSVQDMLNELNRMPYNPAVRIVVVADGNANLGDSRVFVREPGGLVDVTSILGTATNWPTWPVNPPAPQVKNELDTGSRQSLSQFIQWGTSVYSTSQHTFLALMDHGGGWAPDFSTSSAQPSYGIKPKSGGWRGMAMDLSTPSGDTTISTKDTRLALSNGLASGQRIDVLFFDACLMGMLESAYEVRAYADYLVVAENLLYSNEELRTYGDYLATTNISTTTTPPELAQTIVTRYSRITNEGTQVAQAYNPFTMAALDLTRLRATGNLAERVNTLASALLAAYSDAPTLYAALQPVYAQVQKFDYDGDEQIEPTDGYVDLGHFAALLRDNAALPQVVRDAAGAVVTELGPTVLSVRRESGSHSGTTGWDFSQATGLSIFAPLGEQDWRPTRTPTATEQLPTGCYAVSENQRLYYTIDQLQFVTAAPQWASVIERVEPAVPVIHAPCLPLGTTASLASSPRIDSSPFHTPGRLGLTWGVALPFLRR